MSSGTESKPAASSPAGAAPAITVIIPAYNAAGYLRECLEHLARSTVSHECIVVDDGSTDDTATVARSFGAAVMQTPKSRCGPARARNIAAPSAKGEILFFIDADVCVYPETLTRVLDAFQQDPELDALIGSYDSSPSQRDFLSQYKNLMHCFVHQGARREACTFWSGCGAIRKHVFLEHSGFDESYGRPAIEDIELGYRLFRARRKLILDSSLLVKHQKAWSFFGLVKTDILDRGVPWTELILRDRNMPNDLNLQLSQRVSTALMFILLALAAGGAVFAGSVFLMVGLALLFLVLIPYEVEATSDYSSRRVTAVALGLIASIVALAFWNGARLLVPPVLMAGVLLFLRHRYLYNEKRRQITGIVCGAYLLFTIIFVLTYLPGHPLVFLFFLGLSVVIMLNSQFYLFLAAKGGRLFALAAIPFHLLFHFYNGISFLIGLARFSLHRSQSPAASEVSAPSNR
jgi:glycosyltransferase involved in cell wall biosynthesis